MRRALLFALVAGSLMHTAQVLAQPRETPRSIVTRELPGSLIRVTLAGNVNALASIGDDGVLLVDTGYLRTAEELGQMAAEPGGGQVRMIINTHAHADHIGGNAALGDGATILAHRTVRQRMGRYYALPSLTPDGQPNVVIDSPTTVFFNGHEIRLIPLAGGHSDGDVVVHFTEANVACVGDLVLSDSFPAVDFAMGGDPARLVEVLARLVEVLPDGVHVVTGHGRDYTKADLEAYRDRAAGSFAAIRKASAAGKDAETSVREDVLGHWESSLPASRVPAADWIAQVHTSLSEPRPSICQPVTHALVENGVEAAIALYRELKRGQGDSFDFGEPQLNALGYQLLARAMVDEAITIFELNVEAYPEAFNTYDSLGEAYLAAGDNELAIANYQRSLTLNPDNTNATEVLRSLQRD